MELSILLAKVMGIYLVVAGVGVFLKQSSIRQAVNDFYKNDFLAYLAGAFTLILGLLVVLNHNIWESSWVVIVTILGWIILLKGAMYLLLSESVMKKLTGIFNNKSMYGLWSVIVIVLGAYLIYKGFAF